MHFLAAGKVLGSGICNVETLNYLWWVIGDHAGEHEVSTFSDHKALFDRIYSEETSLRKSLACHIKSPENWH